MCVRKKAKTSYILEQREYIKICFPRGGYILSPSEVTLSLKHECKLITIKLVHHILNEGDKISLFGPYSAKLISKRLTCIEKLNVMNSMTGRRP
jgi:hypothetical protein